MMRSLVFTMTLALATFILVSAVCPRSLSSAEANSVVGACKCNVNGLNGICAGAGDCKNYKYPTCLEDSAGSKWCEDDGGCPTSLNCSPAQGRGCL